jgi:uncharacterized protein with HEPN domain
LPAELRARYPEAPWADIIAIGNPLRHEYHRIDDKVLWETATVDLPKLQPIILRMIAESEDRTMRREWKMHAVWPILKPCAAMM